MTEFKHLEEKLMLANQVIFVIRKSARKNSIEKKDFKE